MNDKDSPYFLLTQFKFDYQFIWTTNREAKIERARSV